MIDNDKVTVFFPHNIGRATPMMENLFTDHQNISLDKNASTLIIPIDETPEQYLDTFLYTVPIDYIWDVDIAIPQWISLTSF